MKSELETIETGLRIRKRRKELGLTMQSVAQKIDVTQGAVSQWENGDTSINAENFLKLSLVLRSNPFELFGIDKNSVDEPQFDIAKLAKSIDIFEAFISRKKLILDSQIKAKILAYLCSSTDLPPTDGELSRLIELAK